MFVKHNYRIQTPKKTMGLIRFDFKRITNICKVNQAISFITQLNEWTDFGFLSILFVS